MAFLGMKLDRLDIVALERGIELEAIVRPCHDVSVVGAVHVVGVHEVEARRVIKPLEEAGWPSNRQLAPSHVRNLDALVGAKVKAPNARVDEAEPWSYS